MKPTSLPVFALRPRLLRLFGIASMIVVAALLASCALSRPAPVKGTFLLELTPPPAVATTKPISVRVGIVNVAAPFRGKQFVYRETDFRFEADYYDEFFIAPMIMFSDATAKALVAANAFYRVQPFGGAGDDSDFVLDGFVSELYGDMRNAAAPVAVITITYYLTPSGVPGANVAWTKEYRQRVPLSGNNAEALARAWNTGLSAILADLARDLAAADLPKR